MSEATVTSIGVAPAEDGDEVKALLLQENTALRNRVREFEQNKRETLPKDTVRKVIVDLAEALTGNDEDSYDSEQLEAINEALDTLGLDTIVKEFEIEVEVVLTATVTITVEGSSIEEVTERVENGEFEDEIQAEIDSNDLSISEYSSVSEA